MARWFSCSLGVLALVGIVIAFQTGNVPLGLLALVMGIMMACTL